LRFGVGAVARRLPLRAAAALAQLLVEMTPSASATSPQPPRTAQAVWLELMKAGRCWPRSSRCRRRRWSCRTGGRWRRARRRDRPGRVRGQGNEKEDADGEERAARREGEAGAPGSDKPPGQGTGPAAMVIPIADPHTPTARARSRRSVNTLTMIDSAAGLSIEPPTACRPRNAISHPVLGARPQRRERGKTATARAGRPACGRPHTGRGLRPGRGAFQPGTKSPRYSPASSPSTPGTRSAWPPRRGYPAATSRGADVPGAGR
jgi:hypothetical protein